MQIFLGMKHRSSLWIFILGVGWFRFDICLAERGVAVSPVNKHCVSESHSSVSYTFPAESLNGFLTDFSCLSVFMFEWEIILAADHTLLYVLCMMKKHDLKNRQNQRRDDHKKKIFIE